MDGDLFGIDFGQHTPAQRQGLQPNVPAVLQMQPSTAQDPFFGGLSSLASPASSQAAASGFAQFQPSSAQNPFFHGPSSPFAGHPTSPPVTSPGGARLQSSSAQDPFFGGLSSLSIAHPVSPQATSPGVAQLQSSSTQDLFSGGLSSPTVAHQNSSLTTNQDLFLEGFSSAPPTSSQATAQDPFFGGLSSPSVAPPTPSQATAQDPFFGGFSSPSVASPTSSQATAQDPFFGEFSSPSVAPPTSQQATNQDPFFGGFSSPSVASPTSPQAAAQDPFFRGLSSPSDVQYTSPQSTAEDPFFGGLSSSSAAHQTSPQATAQDPFFGGLSSQFDAQHTLPPAVAQQPQVRLAPPQTAPRLSAPVVAQRASNSQPASPSHPLSPTFLVQPQTPNQQPQTVHQAVVVPLQGQPVPQVNNTTTLAVPPIDAQYAANVHNIVETIWKPSHPPEEPMDPTLKEIKEKFAGQWKLARSDPYDEYLKTAGVGIFSRKLAIAGPVEQHIDVKAGAIHIDFHATFSNQINVFKLEESVENLVEKTRQSVFCSYKDGKLTLLMTPLELGMNRTQEVQRHINEYGELVVIYTCGTVTCRRYFFRINNLTSPLNVVG